jgi:hypothetical protein
MYEISSVCCVFTSGRSPTPGITSSQPGGHLTPTSYISNIVKVKIMLRLTVRLPVWLGAKHPFGPQDQIFIPVKQFRVCWCGALSLTRGWVCRLQLLLVLASAVILGPESLTNFPAYNCSTLTAQKTPLPKLFHWRSSVVSVGTYLFEKKLLSNDCCIFA